MRKLEAEHIAAAEAPGASSDRVRELMMDPPSAASGCVREAGCSYQARCQGDRMACIELLSCPESFEEAPRAEATQAGSGVGWEGSPSGLGLPLVGLQAASGDLSSRRRDRTTMASYPERGSPHAQRPSQVLRVEFWTVVPGDQDSASAGSGQPVALGLRILEPEGRERIQRFVWCAGA